MAITLVVTESISQLISGFPEYVEFETSVPSTVFYTLDGTEPDEASLIADDLVYLPTDGLYFLLIAVAISGDDRSDFFEQEYYTDSSDEDRTRLIGDEGINILKPGEAVVGSLSFDADGDSSQESAIEFQELDIKTSVTDRLGYDIADNSTVSFVNFPNILLRAQRPYQGKISSPNDNNVDFDPSAGLVIIDGSTEVAFNSQVVTYINRPHGTFDVRGDHWNDHLKQNSIVSGNHVKSFYNPSTGLYVSYYYESRENRWIESRQSVSVNKLNLSPSHIERHVFRWIDSRALTKIF